MRLDDYEVKRVSEIYLEDIPYILHPDQAISHLELSLNLNPKSYDSPFDLFGFDHALISDLKDGNRVLVNSFSKLNDLLDVLDHKGSPQHDLPLFLKLRLDELISQQIKRPVSRAYYPSTPQTEEIKTVSNTIMNAVHYVGGVTKGLGDSITSSIESVIDEPSIALDAVNNMLYTAMDAVTYFPDVILNAVAPELSYGAKDRINKQINDVIENVSDDWDEHKSAIESGDFEKAGTVASSYALLATPIKKIPAKNRSMKPFKQTGGGGFIDPADELYDLIRLDKKDVDLIALNTGFKSNNIQKVKDHVFYNKHFLDKYVDYGVPAEMSRFDSDLNQAQAWKRLENGTQLESDIIWLKHEIAEKWYEKTHSAGYTESHNAAEKRWKGNPWEE